MTDSTKIKQARQRSARLFAKRPSAALSTGRTTVNLTSGLRCAVKENEWELLADQPASRGGESAGPGPSFLGRAALGTCMAQGYAMVFAERNIPFDEINVVVESDSDSRGFLAVDGDVPPGISQTRYLVTVESSADEQELLAAMDHADRHSPWLYNFTTALDVKRQVTLKKGSEG